MPRTMFAVTALLLVTAAAPAQFTDPYRVVVVHRPSYWGYGAALTGAANVIDAQGRFMISQQQAHLMNEEVQQKKLETRRSGPKRAATRCLKARFSRDARLSK